MRASTESGATGCQAAKRQDRRSPLPPGLCQTLLCVWGLATSGRNCGAIEPPSDAGQDRPYASAEAAFAGAFIATGLGQRAYGENREYAAALYQLPDGSWHCTGIVAGTRTTSAIPYDAVPVGAVHIIGVHTHGQPEIPEDPGHRYGLDFSQADLRNALRNYRITHGRIAQQLVLSSELKILRLTISAAPAQTLDAVLQLAPELPRLTPESVHGRVETLGQLSIPVDAAPAAQGLWPPGRPWQGSDGLSGAPAR